MFGDGAYLLGIPVPQREADLLQQLIFRVAAKDDKLGLNKELTSKISAKAEFHVTLGVFHPGAFHTNRGLFKHIIHFLKEHKEAYQHLQTLFRGECIVTGVGWDGGTPAESHVVWASVASREVELIRQHIHTLLTSAGVDERHFSFTDPHITLFTVGSHGDRHDIKKPPKERINTYGTKIGFSFRTVCFYRGPRIIATFGPSESGKPSQTKFKKALIAELAKSNKGKVPEYNWGALFRDEELRPFATTIKKIILEKGARGLNEAGYDGKSIGRIMSLIK
ncbi:hypothetical protein D6789_04610 [Candidatus Woesearchaeota archaeon]|nr:MAG: hypothetical protein D6789_04610 [Candidatus Woesearchaeota archaeon]